LKAHIVDLSEYRRLHRPPPRTPAGAPASAEPHYYCLRCESDAFRLSEGGTVHCVQCGARMRNLLVSERPAGGKLPSDSQT
jgi:DNA-directed RNA polymerase subunit RPC12/RpoP